MADGTKLYNTVDTELTASRIVATDASSELVSLSAPVANGVYVIHNDGVTSGQVTSITFTDGICTAITVVP